MASDQLCFMYPGTIAELRITAIYCADSGTVLQGELQ